MIIKQRIALRRLLIESAKAREYILLNYEYMTNEETQKWLNHFIEIRTGIRGDE